MLELAAIRLNTAHLYEARGYLEKAEDSYKGVISTLESTSGSRAPELVQALTKYAALLHRLQRHEEANQLELRAKSIQQ